MVGALFYILLLIFLYIFFRPQIAFYFKDGSVSGGGEGGGAGGVCYYGPAQTYPILLATVDSRPRHLNE